MTTRIEEALERAKDGTVDYWDRPTVVYIIMPDETRHPVTPAKFTALYERFKSKFKGETP